MSQLWTDAIREAFASAPSGVVILETLELSHESLESSLFLVKDFTGHTFTLEDETEQFFEPAPFRLSLPATGTNGLQEMSIAIDNVDKRVSDFVELVSAYTSAVLVKYRAYLSTEKTAPQNGVPLVLYMSDIRVTAAECVGRASFADMVNRPFLSTNYNVRLFPGLA